MGCTCPNDVYMKTILIAKIVAALIVGCFCVTARVPSINATESIKLDADRQFNFAEYFFERKEYFRAIGEFKRFIYFFPYDQKISKARFRIGLSYFHSQRYRQAIEVFDHFIDTYEDDELAIDAHFLISECYARQKEFGPAITRLNNLLRLSNDSYVIDKARYLIGWRYIDLGNWEKASNQFDQISAQNKTRLRIEALSARLKQADAIAQKDPSLAGVLAVIPGAGHIYTERYQDAMVAFIINAGLIWAGYEAFNRGNKALGGVITLVGLGFYSGNIYSAVNSAHKYNKTQKRQFIRDLNQKLKVELSAAPSRKSFSMALKLSF